MRLAEALGMSLQQCMREHTHREYRLWMDYFEFELNSPNRSDHYLMRIAAEMRACHAKEGASISLEDFKVNFERKKPVKSWSEMTEEERQQGAAEFSRAIREGFKAAYDKPRGNNGQRSRT